LAHFISINFEERKGVKETVIFWLFKPIFLAGFPCWKKRFGLSINIHKNSATVNSKKMGATY
jgi:hypothetical protein